MLSSIKKFILKRKWIILILLVIVVAFWFYQRQQAKAKQAAVSKYTVKRTTFKDELSFSGDVNAEEHETLHFQASGRLSWVGVKEGDTVKKGQALAALDQRQLQKSLKKEMNAYLATRQDFDQSKDDNQDKSLNGASQAVRDAAGRLMTKSQSNLDNAVIDVELQTIALEYANLYSPIDGIVTKADPADAGVNVTAASGGYEVVNPDTLYFSASADQTEVVRLTEGMSADIVLDAYPDETEKGTISSISFTPKEGESGTVYDVKIKLDQTNGLKYRLGMTGDATFVLKQRANVLAIPADYITSEDNKKYVMKDVNGKQTKTEIKTGEESDNGVEILSGLQDGDVIYEPTK